MYIMVSRRTGYATPQRIYCFECHHAHYVRKTLFFSRSLERTVIYRLLGLTLLLITSAFLLLGKVMAVSVVCGVARLFGQWPSSSTPSKSELTRTGSVSRKSEIDMIPRQAVEISQKQTVSPVDGN